MGKKQGKQNQSEDTNSSRASTSSDSNQPPAPALAPATATSSDSNQPPATAPAPAPVLAPTPVLAPAPAPASAQSTGNSSRLHSSTHSITPGNNYRIIAGAVLTLLIASSPVVLNYSASINQFAIGIEKIHKVGVQLYDLIIPSKKIVIMPEDTLGIFVHKEKKSIPDGLLEKVKKLPLDKFTMYAKAVCLSAENPKALKSSMDQSMNRVPKVVREMVAERALGDDIIDYQDIERDTATDTTNTKNTASAFYLFFHTKKLGDKMYRSCILVTGVDLKIGEQITGYEEKTEEIPYNEEVCEDGFLGKTCRQVTKMRKHTTRSPLIKNSVLTAEESETLFYFMTKNAIDNAEALITNAKALSGHSIEKSWEPFPKPRIA